MAVSPSDLRTIPLFKDITDAHLEALRGACELKKVPAGEVLFEAGSAPGELLVLTSGEVSLEEEGNPRFRLTPIAPIGELGAITGSKRTTTAIATQPSEILRIEVAQLMDFFEKNGDVAFPFYHNLLGIVADKVRRDTRRLEEMRANLIRTQRAMKRLRDVVLESEETPLSKTVCETLEDLIEHNRRAHYLVEPTRSLSCSVRLDGGALAEVSEISDGWLRIGRVPDPRPAQGQHQSYVLVLPGGEIPISGSVEAIDSGGVLLKLDMLIEGYAAILQDYLTRVQMLDFVV